MAIAAAAGSRPATRARLGPRPRVIAVMLIAVLAIAAGAVAALGAVGHGHSSRSSARAATASGGASGGESTAAAQRRGRQAAARDPFNASLNGWLAHRDGDITAAVQDLRGGRIWLYRAGHAEHTASIDKVDILATLLHERQGDGGLSAEQQAQATGMIESSNDDDASDLYAAEGGAGAVQAFDRSIGMTQTSTSAAWGLTSTTPTDQLKLLHAVLFKGELSRASRDYEYGLMRSIIPFDTWGVTAGPQHHATIAFKNGWLPDPDLWQINSIGAVNGDGRHYLIAVMTRDNPTEGYGIGTIEHVSRSVWQHLDGIARPASTG